MEYDAALKRRTPPRTPERGGDYGIGLHSVTMWPASYTRCCVVVHIAITYGHGAHAAALRMQSEFKANLDK